MSQARIANLERELAQARAEINRLRIAMKTRQILDAEQIRELERAVRALEQGIKNQLHAAVPLDALHELKAPPSPFDPRNQWTGYLHYPHGDPQT